MIYLTGNIIVIIMLSDQESAVVGILPGHGHRRATMAQHGDLLKIYIGIFGDVYPQNSIIYL